MHLTEDFPISSRLIHKAFRDEQKMNPNSARNIRKLLARTRPDSNCGLESWLHDCQCIVCYWKVKKLCYANLTWAPQSLYCFAPFLGAGNLRPTGRAPSLMSAVLPPRGLNHSA